MFTRGVQVGLALFALTAMSLVGHLRAQSASIPAALPSVLADAPVPALLISQAALPGSNAQQQDTAGAITLVEAIGRAQANEPSFAASLAESRSAQIDRALTRNALLPSAVYHNQVLYTQPNGDVTKNLQGPGNQPSPRFIANNAVREYASQVIATETVSLGQVAEVRLATAAAARTAAQTEVARRGLIATVVSLFYQDIAAAQKLVVARRAQDEARAFTQLTQKREAGRESAHADVVKAQLTELQRQRDVADAALNAERARLELGTLLFADPRTAFTLAPVAAQRALPTRAEIDAAAARENPTLRAAFAALRASDAEVARARAAYLPDLGVSVAYGIDAPQFAINGPLLSSDATVSEQAHVKNLGYSAVATLDIPVWDWLSTDKRIKQSQIRRQLAQVELTAAQKRLIVELDEFYAEAAAAQQQVASLAQSVQMAEESLRLTKLRYSAGEATVLEVVDAQAALTLAEDADADGQVRYQASLANVQTLTGNL